MNKPLHITMLSTWLISVYATGSFAATEDNMVTLPAETRAAAHENMVMLPSEENMVMLPSSAPSPTQNAAIFVPATGNNYVEAGINVHSVSNNQGDWFGQFVKGEIQTDENNRWRAQVQHQEAFHDQGTFVSAGNFHSFNDRTFSDIGAGIGSDASFLSRYRIDAALGHRWLEAGNLVTILGTTWTRASQTYSSIGGFFDVSYYFASPWILQAGIRTDVSDPGSVAGTAGYTALTYGYQKRYYLTGRIGYGREAYQLLGNGNNITNAFYSHTAGLNWRQWVGNDWGFNLGTEYYKNPAYHRTGGIISVFKEF